MFILSVPKEDSNNVTFEMQRMMDAYGDVILRTSFMYLKDMQKAEDAFQEVFIKVFKKYSLFRGDSSEKTWIIKITINVCKDMLKSSWFKRAVLTDKFTYGGQNVDLEGRIIKKEDNENLLNAVISLSPLYKDVILLYYYQEFDTTEISKVLNISEGTVRSRLHRARELLKNKLGGRNDFDE